LFGERKSADENDSVFRVEELGRESEGGFGFLDAGRIWEREIADLALRQDWLGEGDI
jgi:hypothetical protein